MDILQDVSKRSGALNGSLVRLWEFGAINYELKTLGMFKGRFCDILRENRLVWGSLERSWDVWRRSGQFGELCGLLFKMWVHFRDVWAVGMAWRQLKER